MGNDQKKEMYEFSGERSRSYKKALSKFPNVWEEDMLVMKDYLAPKSGENILEVGAGSGFFSFEISSMIGQNGHLYVTDPSPEQLDPIIQNQPKNVTVLSFPADKVKLDKIDMLDAIWTRGALHHAENKTGAFKLFHKYAKPNARLVVFDIFANSQLANYFDEHVATTCTTGHEVSFLSKKFAASLCRTTGWDKPFFKDIHLQWHFKNKEDIGIFLSLLHSNKPQYPASESLFYAEKLLGVKRVKSGYDLYWPMTLMTTKCIKS